MKEFYHVARQELTGIPQFELMKFNGHISAEGLHTGDEFHNYKTALFPEGISRHGEIYLHNPFKSDGPSLSFAPNELILETSFDLVRQLKYPEKKSRFECSFGCLTLEDARRIKNETFGGQGKIYRVSCDKYFIADMKYLKQAGSVIGLQIIAEKYWSGQSSANPFWEVLMECPVKIIELVE